MVKNTLGQSHFRGGSSVYYHRENCAGKEIEKEAFMINHSQVLYYLRHFLGIILSCFIYSGKGLCNKNQLVAVCGELTGSSPSGAQYKLPSLILCASEVLNPSFVELKEVFCYHSKHSHSAPSSAVLRPV